MQAPLTAISLTWCRKPRKVVWWLGKAATKNTVAQALRRLQAANIVARLGVGHYRVEDEAFAEWLRRRRQR